MDLSAAAWNERYINKDTPWDLSAPTPEFVRIVKSGFFKKGRAIVPGGGRGHDAILLSQAGLDVDLVDFSEMALTMALEEASKAKAVVHAYRQNFFDLAQLPYHKNSYDYLLEYTFFCAIDPSLRQAYVETCAKLLKPGGRFVGLFFPLTTDKAGPPFVVSKEEIEALFRPFFDFTLEPAKESVKPRSGRELLFIGTRK